MNPHDLPVYRQKDKILDALRDNQVIVVESPTGSGKTTQLPVILHEAGYSEKGIIGVTQPRRIATLSVSDFIAKQMGTGVPGVVGYKMRFEDMTNPSTAIKIMTDGILLQEMKLDPFLAKYGVIMVDEAHERSLNIDFILGLLKQILEHRKDFKVIVSSATINAEVFSEYFGECPIVKIETEAYPVTVIYDPIVEAPQEGREAAPGRGENDSSGRKREDAGRVSAFRSSDEAIYDKILSIVGRVLDQRTEDESGDMLVFLPGEKTIKECAQRLSDTTFAPRLHLVPLYARLGKDEQERVFDPAPEGKSKVVIATNIAETSVTIDGITVVIDSGLAKLNYYNPRSFTSSLIETPISKASCNQRKGRAGRTRPGVCYRLYPRKEFESRPLFTTEEIYRTDLSEVVLRMAELGINDFEEFDFISKPPKSGIAGAIDILNLLDALTPQRTLSRTGEMMCEFPLLPRLSRMIVEAIMKYPDVIHEVLVAASFLSASSPYVLPPGLEMEARRAHHAFRDPMGDFVSYLNLFDSFKKAANKTRFCERNFLDERTMLEIVRIREQLELIVSDLGVPVLRGGSLYDYLCAVSRGLVQFVCARQERGLFRSLTAEKIQIHPGSVMFRENPDFIVAGEIVRTTRMYAMSVSPLPKEILYKISPSVAEGLLSIVGSGRKETARAKAAARTAEGGAETAAEAKAPRDFTNRIKIGGEVFALEKGKGRKKVAVLEWDAFDRIRASLDKEAGGAFRGMLASVRHKQGSLLDGEKLETVIRISDWLDIDTDLARGWPKGVNFEVFSPKAEAGEGEGTRVEGRAPKIDMEALGRLVENSGHVLQVARAGGKEKKLGFVTLYTDGAGVFWFRVSKGFHTALNESISSLESLADAAGEKMKPDEQEKIGKVYRKLNSFFGEE